MIAPPCLWLEAWRLGSCPIRSAFGSIRQHLASFLPNTHATSPPTSRPFAVRLFPEQSCSLPVPASRQSRHSISYPSDAARCAPEKAVNRILHPALVQYGLFLVMWSLRAWRNPNHQVTLDPSGPLMAKVMLQPPTDLETLQPPLSPKHVKRNHPPRPRHPWPQKLCIQYKLDPLTERCILAGALFAPEAAPDHCS